jgi:hypothetical protein
LQLSDSSAGAKSIEKISFPNAKEVVMPVVFEGSPPYEVLIATSADPEPSLDGVVVTLTVDVEGLPTDTVPVQFVLEPEVARELAACLQVAAGVVDRWRQHS